MKIKEILCGCMFSVQFVNSEPPEHYYYILLNIIKRNSAIPGFRLMISQSAHLMSRTVGAFDRE